MKAMILAAGRGSRMQHLTDDTPKPMLKVGNTTLIEYHLNRIAKAGITECLINVHYLGDKIQQHVGNGGKYGLKITYSVEKEKLETGGGIIQALPFFEGKPFLLLSSDVVTDYPLEKLLKTPTNLAHLVLVPNPDHHPEGDFSLNNNGIVGIKEDNISIYNNYTYGNMGVYQPSLLERYEPGFRKLGDILREHIETEQITGELYEGGWLNTDTPERLEQAEKIITQNGAPEEI